MVSMFLVILGRGSCCGVYVFVSGIKLSLIWNGMGANVNVCALEWNGDQYKPVPLGLISDLGMECRLSWQL